MLERNCGIFLHLLANLYHANIVSVLLSYKICPFVDGYSGMGGSVAGSGITPNNANLALYLKHYGDLMVSMVKESLETGKMETD